MHLPRPRLLATTAVLAIGAPVGIAAWVGRRTDDLAAHLGRTAEVVASIGKVDADLTGTVRLSEVQLGSLFQADAIEASVALEPLLAGQLGADEIRVAGPRVDIDVDSHGDSDLARVIRRLARASGSGQGPKPKAQSPSARLRRIVVTSGALTARIAGIGELTADEVELVPDENGVRVITGPVALTGATGKLSGRILLARSAAEVALPRVAFGRVLGVAGTGEITAAGRTIALREVAVGRLSPDGALEARALVDDGGVPREISAELSAQQAGDLAITVRGNHVPLAAFAQLAPHGVDVAGTHATGSVSLRRHDGALQLAVDGSLDDLAIDHRAIAAQPVTFSAHVAGALAVSPDAVVVEHLALELGAAKWAASGWLRRGTPISGQLDVSLASAPCLDLVQSLPAEMRGPLDGMVATGMFGGRGRLAIDLAAPAGEGVELVASLDNRCEVTTEPPGADVTALTDVAEQTYADGTRARVGRGTPGWVELRKLPSWLSGAFISAEDALFYEHHGFDLVQIARSFEIDLRDRRLARGGSTISQQLVKNAFLTQRRSFDRKVQEAILTWRLESRLDKKQILERYLNIIELGPHVFGVAAAAQYWFGKSARDLSVHEAAFLAALTSEPQSMSRRVRRAGTLDADSTARVDTVLRAMRRDGVIDKDELDAARERPLKFSATALKRDP
jgi:hypothetical protein